MSWLRMASIATFTHFNPSWEIRLHGTPEDIRKHGLWYAQEADWTWWRMLAKHGGFQVATDIIFVRPIPDAWLNCGLNACKNGTTTIYQFAMLGAVAGHPFMLEAEKACAEMSNGSGLGYQAMGVDMLKRVGHKDMLESGGLFYDQPMGALCHFQSHETGTLWKDTQIALPESVIGIHWYGGHDASLGNEKESGPEHPSFICRLARGVLSG